MAEQSFILATRTGTPHTTGAAGADAVAIPIPTGQPPAQAAEVVREALCAAGCSGRAAVLAIPSASCLCSVVRSHDLPPKDRQRALLYRLEEKLPVAAEDVVADFVFTSDGALGVCALRSELAPLVQALEGQGIPIAAVCPGSLLAMQDRIDSATAGPMPVDGRPREPYDAIVLGWEGKVELVLLERGRPRGWYVFTDDPMQLLLHLKLESFIGNPVPRNALAVGLSETVLSALAAGPCARVTKDNSGAAGGLPVAMAGRILSGRTEAWVNFRDGLGAPDRLRPVRGPLQCAAVAVFFCMLSACGAMLWRAARYDLLATRYADEQREVFRQTFPRQLVPPDVSSRLASEERGLRGLSGDTSAPPPRPPGLVGLRDLLARLPGDVRFRVLELRLDGAGFVLEGQARSHGDADAIAAALRASGGFSVDPPRTEQLSSGSDAAETPTTGAPASVTPASTASADKVVAFTLTGTIIGDVPAARKVAP